MARSAGPVNYQGVVAQKRGAKGSSRALPKRRAISRDSGIRLLGELPWGAHICLFYESKEDLLDTNIAFLGAGLRNKELCIWAISEPLAEAEARNAFANDIPDFDLHLAAGDIEILRGHEWYLKGNEFDLQRITGGWHDKLNIALAKGYEGIRISGNAFWLATSYWKDFCEYEHELDRSLGGRPMIVLCTYALSASRAVDLLDVARAHQFTIARRKGDWEFLQSPELLHANHEIRRLRDALDILSKPFPGSSLLTARERAVLAQTVRGVSSKEAARALGISPRTVEFHRSNTLQKLGVRNTAELMGKVLSE
jgi:DNA-binding CsgD family transcriptional regulator